MITTITELKCKNYWKLPGMILISMRLANQAKSTPGNISTYIKAKWLKAYTLTSWENTDALKTFRNSGLHKQAMKTMFDTASAFRFKTLEVEKQISWEKGFSEIEKVEMKYTRA